MFNLEKSLYFRFSVISGLICVLSAKLFINLFINLLHAKYFATFLLGETLLVLLGYFVLFFIIPCVALTMLSLDFLFTEKVQSKKSLNNSFLKVICYILFCVSQMIFFVCIPLSVITNFMTMPFLLILIGSIIYYYVRNNKNKTGVNPEKIEVNKVENQNNNDSSSALIISILILGLLFISLFSIPEKTHEKIEKKKVPVKTEQKQKSNIKKSVYLLKDSSNKILNDDIYSDIWVLKDKQQYIVTLLSSNKVGVIDKDGKYKDENNNTIMYLLNNNGKKLLSANYIDSKKDVNRKNQYIITSESRIITGKDLKIFTLYDKDLKKLFSFKSENDGEINGKYIIIKNNEKESVLNLKGEIINPEELKKYKSIDNKPKEKESVNFKVSGYDFCTNMGYGYYSCTQNFYPPFFSGRDDVFNPKGRKIYKSLTSWKYNENFIITANEIYDLKNNKRIQINSDKLPINIKEDRFLINQNGKNIIIDKNKNKLIKQEYTQIKKLSQFMTESEEKKAKEILYTIENNGKFGVINDKGEIIIPIEYEYIGFERYGSTDDKFVAKKDGKYGYINYNNEIVADFVFDEEPYYLLPNGNVFIKKDINEAI